MKPNPILYIVPTPIGNLKDMTFRAVEVLKSVSLILAEDTRTSSYLLKHYEITTQLLSYHKFNERKRTTELIDRLKSGEEIALISDAGTPGISDPGSILIKAAIKEGIEVVTLPGATAFVPALVSSGLNSDSFCFLGFLPEKKRLRDELLESVKAYKQTLIFYCSPHDLFNTMKAMQELLGDRNIVIAKEISKLHETFYRGRFSTLIDSENLNLKGEFVILVESFIQEEITIEQVQLLLKEEISKGLKGKDAIKKVGENTKMRKNLVYEIFTNMKRSQ